MVDTHDIARLIKKHLEGALTPEEQARLDAWVAGAPENSAYFEHIENGDAVLEDLKELHRLLGPEETSWPEVLAARLNKAIGGVCEKSAEADIPEVQAKTRHLPKWLPYAAAVLIALGGTWFFFGHEVIDRLSADRRVTAEDIAPGTNRATLTLADGRTIDLDEGQTGIVVGAEDITYQDGSALGLPPSGAVGVGANDYSPDVSGSAQSVNMLSLTTPKGGTYQITLPDGSRVWLNAGSTLKYPSRFSGEERIVELTGEAFFEIRPQAGKVGANKYSPFNVQTASQTVHVLGTQFNISAYADEASTKTTLVTGRVRVAISPPGEPVPTGREGRGVTEELKPGEQSITRARLPGQGADIQVHSVDVTAYTAWKSGKFIFTGKPFTAVMAELARWYDLEVVYDGPVPEIAFFGGIHRNNNLSAVLKVLESAQVRYTVQSGNRLVIHHNNATGKEVIP